MQRQLTDNQSLNPITTQYVVYFILLALINLDNKTEQRRHIYRLALTSRAWRDLMLAPLNIKLFRKLQQDHTIVSKSALEILRHRLFAAAGVVTRKNDGVLNNGYEPNLSNLINLPSDDTTAIEEVKSSCNHDTQDTVELRPSTDSSIKGSMRCYAVGILTDNGLKKSFKSEGTLTSKFKVFEERIDAETYVQSIPETVCGYTIPPRVVQPVHIRPRKLSSGGVDANLALQFFKVREDEMRSASATPTPIHDNAFIYMLD